MRREAERGGGKPGGRKLTDTFGGQKSGAGKPPVRSAYAGAGSGGRKQGALAKPQKNAYKTENGRALTDEREAVLLALLSYGKNNTFSNVLVKRTLDECGHLSDAERAFIKRLLEGVIERKQELDAVIEHYTGRSVSRLHPALHQILRMGIYQILYMDAVPDSAACNESVRLAKKHGPARLSGFVNGVLRNAARDNIKKKDTSANTGQSLPDGDSGPDSALWPSWLVQMWTEQLGEEETKNLLDELMEIHPVSIRLCGHPSGKEREQILTALRDAGVVVEKGRWHPDHYILRKTSDITKLPGFLQGQWTVQDVSSMLAVEAAGLKGTETVYDVCAAPGGKSFFAAQKLCSRMTADGQRQVQGVVHSFDLTPKKTARMRDGVGRLHLSNIIIDERDALNPVPADEEGAADVLLCDLPCSGLGVIGKKRDIKYRASLEGITKLQKLQRKILSNAVHYLKEGGILVYSTCTISRAENEENAEFIEKELGLIPDPAAPFLPEGISGIEGNRIQLLPHLHGTDGFFIARFRKPAAEFVLPEAGL